MRSVRSTNKAAKKELTVESIRQLAKEVGSTALDRDIKEEAICNTDGCLDSGNKKYPNQK
jgi:hypothetical protein